MTDLVVVSLEPWDEVWRRNQHVVAGLLDKHPGLKVLFVEPPQDPLHAWRRKEPVQRGTGLRSVQDVPGAAGRLWAYQPTKWLPRRVDSRGDGRRARHVVNAARGLGFDNPILWVNDPFGAEVLHLTGWRSLYDMTDDWLSAERPRRETERTAAQEQRLLESVGVVVACSPALMAKTGDATAPAVLIPNAVDVSAYAVPAERPSDVLDRPYALYVGTLHRDRLDVDLCVRTAEAVRDAGELVLLGPVALDRTDTEALVSSGVRVLGSRSRGSVPAYLQHASVLVVPHVLSEFTESLDPIKAYEYQAAGRAVVSTAVPGFRESISPLVHVVSAGHFPQAVAEVLADPPPRAGITDAPDWADRVADFANVINRLEAT